MKILVIGGTGHIGSYLTPRLVLSGHDVSVVARHTEPQYTYPRLGWPSVRWIVADRLEEEKDGTWAKRMAGIDVDVVMDLICYHPEQAVTMYEAFKGRILHYIQCGSIWAYGPPERVPYEEWFARHPMDDYGGDKVLIEEFLQNKWRHEGFPATVIHPGHISGRKWLPIDPQGALGGVDIYYKLARGEPVYLPDKGLATLHHVHGDDVAQLFESAMLRPERALGESFSAVAPYALSLLSCCRAVAAMLGAKPNLRFVPLEDLEQHMGGGGYGITVNHAEHSPCCSIAKCQELLGYVPRYTIEQIFAECLDYLIESGQLEL